MSSKSPVLELQQMASDPTIDITTLLRKAMIVATKLSLHEFRKWIDLELNGYSVPAEVPLYREVRGELWAKNPYHGLVPIMFGDSKLMDLFCNIKVTQGIGSLAHLLSSWKPGNPSPTYPLAPEATTFLLQQQDNIGRLPPVLTIGISSVAAILDAVRTAILDWSLKLEQEGILGEGISFSHDEVEKAVGNQQIQIGTFQGIFGNVHGSSVNQSLRMQIRKGSFQTLKKQFRAAGMADADLSELKAAIQAEPSPPGPKSFGPRVAGWIGKMMTKAASGTWSIATDAAGDLLATALKAYYGWPP